MELKPLGWGPSILIFIINATLLRVALYYFPPAYTQATGQPYLAGYLIGWGGSMLLVFLASLIAYRVDSHPMNLRAFTARYRLEKLEKVDWIWTLALLVVSAAFLSALSFTTEWLKSIPSFAPHPAFPPDMVDMTNNLTPGVLFGMPLRGEWWVLGIYFIGWFLNIAGEEFWYRGWMLPRQEVAFGKNAWLVNGLMFNFQHTFQPWNFLAMLPGSLFLSYVVQRQRKTWVSMVWHGLVNAVLLVFVIRGVIS